MPSPTRPSSVRSFPEDHLAFALDLFRAPLDAFGLCTPNASDSLVLAIQAYRDQARHTRPLLQTPEMIAPISIAPAVASAALSLGVKLVSIPLDTHLRADIDAARRAITDQTILLLASAPALSTGSLDPIDEIAMIAQTYDLGFHAEASAQGFLLPFLRDLGYPLHPFDLWLPGVTSLSADLPDVETLASKASFLLFRNRDLHPYIPPTFGPSFSSLDLPIPRREDMIALTKRLMDTTDTLLRALRGIPSLRLLGRPDAPHLAFTSDTLDLLALAKSLQDQGWTLAYHDGPPRLCLHVSLDLASQTTAFLDALRASLLDLLPS